MLNGVKSDLLPVSIGIPQGSVLGPTLFVLSRKDLRPSVPSGPVYMFAGDTTIYCVSETADLAIDQLNKALREFYNWCLNNRLTPHPSKSDVILLSKRAPIGPIAPVFLGNSVLSLVTKTKLLGLTVDQKLFFLPRAILKDFYFKVILPSVKYCLVLWGSRGNSDLFKSIERLHCRAARVI